MAHVILGVGLLLFAGSVFISLFRRTQIPDVLLLILLGVLLGPVGHLVSPADLGRAGSAMSTIALTVLLFESGLSLRLDVLRRSLRATVWLTVPAFVLAMATVSVLGHLALGLPWPLALALGAILGGTSSAVVIPMVKQLGLQEVPGTALVLESALTDVLTIVLAGTFLGAFRSGSADALAVASSVAASFTFASILGGVAALLFLFAVNVVRRLPNAMVAVIGFVLVSYGVAELLGVSGAIAVLTLGFVLSNRIALGIPRLWAFRHVAGQQEPRYVAWFLADLIFILKTFFFVYLGISVRFSDWRLAAIALALVLALYASRATVVRLTQVPAATSRRDAGVMAVMGPKGLAAAVLAGVPAQLGLAQGELIQQFTYMVVLASVALTSTLVPLLESGVFRPLSDALFGCFTCRMVSPRQQPW